MPDDRLLWFVESTKHGHKLLNVVSKDHSERKSRLPPSFAEY